MDVEEFRIKVKPNMMLSANGQEFLIKQVVRFRFDDGTLYIKCWLNDDYVFADDSNENMFILVKPTKTIIAEPFPKELEFDAKKFNFLYTAHAVAEEILGEEVFEKGDSERFWDYKAEDNSYLSLGINDKTSQRMDFYGRIVDNNTVQLNENNL